MVKVYKITNTKTSKVYVGITKQRYLSRRLWEHTNRKNSAGSYLHRSINKYGAEHFTMELLHEVDTPEEAKLLEKKYIKDLKLNMIRHPDGIGMNMTDGGDGSYGHKHTAKSKKKFTGKNNHNYGIKGVDNPSSKLAIIKQYAKDGTFVAEHATLRNAARVIKPQVTCNRRLNSISSNIWNSTRPNSRSKSAYGYTWTIEPI